MSVAQNDVASRMAREAQEDADLVAALLKRVSYIRWEADTPLQLPAKLLLGLGLVMRLAIWEQSGITQLLNRRMPSSTKLLQALVRTYFHDTGELSDAVLSLAFQIRFEVSLNQIPFDEESFANARLAMRGDIDDEILEAMARLLLDVRRKQSK